MISEVTIVAIVGAAATVLVGVSAAFAQVYGPAWRDAKARRLDRELAARDLRYERAEALVKAATDHYLGMQGATIKLANARSAFFATLRAGEAPVEQYVALVLSTPKSTPEGARVPERLAEGLFRYLRGDLSLNELPDLGLDF